MMFPKHNQLILTDQVVDPSHASPASGTVVASSAILVAPFPKMWLTTACLKNGECVSP